MIATLQYQVLIFVAALLVAGCNTEPEHPNIKLVYFGFDNHAEEAIRRGPTGENMGRTSALSTLACDYQERRSGL